jgi:large subunit ribosomal protein L4
MPIVDVVDLKNAKVGEIELPDTVFAAEVNEALLYEAVRQHRASLRAGTHATKVRGSVAGSGKKLWKQKGTGRARMGSVRSPIWRHGGTVHGPQPRDYSYELPRKMAAGALRSALSAKLRDGQLTVVREFSFADPKTKGVIAALVPFEAKKVLVVESGENRNLELGARNLQGVVVLKSREVTVYHLLDAQRVLVSELAAQKLGKGLDPHREKETRAKETQPEQAQ